MGKMPPKDPKTGKFLKQGQKPAKGKAPQPKATKGKAKAKPVPKKKQENPWTDDKPKLKDGEKDELIEQLRQKVTLLQLKEIAREYF